MPTHIVAIAYTHLQERKHDISFTINFVGQSHSIQTYQGEYRNLMQLITDKVPAENFGDCKGMGRCGTCMVIATGFQHGPPAVERNEQSTLDKAGLSATGLRLACQVLINDNLQNAVIEISEGSGYYG